jgi:hypothetical protein
MKIKFIDLAQQNREIRERVEREFAEIHERTAYVAVPRWRPSSRRSQTSWECAA